MLTVRLGRTLFRHTPVPQLINKPIRPIKNMQVIRRNLSDKSSKYVECEYPLITNTYIRYLPYALAGGFVGSSYQYFSYVTTPRQLIYETEPTCPNPDMFDYINYVIDGLCVAICYPVTVPLYCGYILVNKLKNKT